MQFCAINLVCNEILKAEFVAPTLMITVVLTNDLPSFIPISPPDFVTSGVHRVRNRECSSRALCVGLCVFVLTSFGRKRGDVMKFSLKA